MSSFNLENTPSQKGKIAIVTGANIGLGYETALALAKKDVTVILACRNLDKAKEAMKNIAYEVPDADLEIILLDLNSLDSVRKFAKEYTNKYEHLDFLIANAGIMAPPFQKTKDGFESQFGVNYLAHFLLANLLFPLLEKSKAARIVMLSSIAHKKGEIDFENLNAEKSYSKWPFYSQSKLACLMFAYELDRRIKAANLSIKAVAAHPGLSQTNLAQHLPKIGQFLFNPMANIIGQDAAHGALSTLMATLDSAVKGGEYYGPTGFMEAKGKPDKVKSTKISQNEEVAEKLWIVSEELTGQKFEI